MDADRRDDPLARAVRRVAAAAERRAAALARRALARRGPPVREEAIVLRSTAGYKLDAWLHVAEGEAPAGEPRPAVVLCPGIDDDARVFVNWQAPVHVREAAALGYVVARFDPAGRGGSWGEEDWGGPEHQDDVATVVRFLADRPGVDPDRIGILAISMGVVMAVGAVALEGAPAAWVLDWEGPCDREIITSGGRRMAPAGGHSLDDEVYWRPREPVRHVGRMSCAYVRLQGERDHAQPGELRHARRMVAAAAEGDLPWFQLNDHPRGEPPARPRWLPPGEWAANRAVLRKLRELRWVRRGD